MSWGNKLTVVFILFGAMISYMVYRCMKMPVDLVTADYYKEELAYQEVIDGTKAANALSALPRLSENGERIELCMPSEMRGRSLEGSIVFYCPSDMERDRRVSLQPDADGRQWIQLLPAGNYTAKVSWRSGGKLYYAEQPVYIH
ncbi:FixH family protein [Dinghuibacter silviterrae]|uniref:FixH protein n=1 Tax=Dinghuibacter silviterrae TaxID=1539049 RepID=A0A4R8DGD9_9BACT|nr:FixH family protein [Dinghuibacter silviterrae]TDW96703.1 FixH protein [Dinghuibacter silviterrae]